jgi:hypothetical protein
MNSTAFSQLETRTRMTHKSRLRTLTPTTTSRISSQNQSPPMRKPQNRRRWKYQLTTSGVSQELRATSRPSALLQIARRSLRNNAMGHPSTRLAHIQALPSTIPAVWSFARAKTQQAWRATHNKSPLRGSRHLPRSCYAGMSRATDLKSHMWSGTLLNQSRRPPTFSTTGKGARLMRQQQIFQRAIGISSWETTVGASDTLIIISRRREPCVTTTSRRQSGTTLGKLTRCRQQQAS